MNTLNTLFISKRKWFLKNKNWLSVPKLTPILIALANNIQKKEQELDSIAGNTRFASLMADALIENIKDNWAIEGINLDSLAIRSSIVKRLGLRGHPVRLNK